MHQIRQVIYLFKMSVSVSWWIYVSFYKSIYFISSSTENY